jgi:hypothetical protein
MASAAILAVSILMAFYAASVTQLVVASVQVVGLLGGAVWLGVFWRRANSVGVWASVLGALAAWGAMRIEPAGLAGFAPLETPATWLASGGELLGLRGASKPVEIVVTLAVEIGLLVVVSLLTRPHAAAQLDPFYARLLTPVGREAEVAWSDAPSELPESATLGLEGTRLDYRKSSAFAYAFLQRMGIEVPRLTWFDWGGFALAWLLVLALVALLVWLARLGT